MTRVVYTIGYGAMKSPAELLAIAVANDLTVVDIRGRPQSRKAGFGGRQLPAFLGSRYVWHGDLLGGVYHLPNATKLWTKGIPRLLASVERPLLLCQCHEPSDCHRHAVSMAILAMDAKLTAAGADGGVRVVHIFENEAIDAAELSRAIDDQEHYDCIVWDDPAEIVEAFE